MDNKQVLITTSSFGTDDTSARELLAKAGFLVKDNPFKRTLTEAEIKELMKLHRPVGLIAGLEPLTAGVLEAASDHLKAISRCGVGLDNVDLNAAKRLGIAVRITPDAPSSAVAELAVGMMLNLIRSVSASDRMVRSGKWKKQMGFLLEELCVGVLGLGRIGKKVALFVSAFGGKVVASDVQPDKEWAAKHHVRLLDREELLRTADIVSLHLPYSSGELHHLINEDHLLRMKQGSYLINTSRGGLVDEAALAKLLASGHLAGAAIDTFEKEPYDGPLKNVDNVILTPHIGSYARATRVRMEYEAAQNLVECLKGRTAKK